MVKMKTTEELQCCILDIQRAALACMSLKNNPVTNDEVYLDLYEHGKDTPRYQIYVVDVVKRKNHAEYAAFVVPHGREHEWLFSTKSGRKHLVQTCKYNRLAIATMCAGQQYYDFQSVKDELSDIAIQLAPKNYRGKVLFLCITYCFQNFHLTYCRYYSCPWAKK